jgi:hypothetical protein
MSTEYTEGDWVLWQCRNGVEIAARRTAVQDDTTLADDTTLVDDATWECGTWLWYAGRRHTVAGIDHPFDLIRPIRRLVPDGAAEQNERLQQELHETHKDLGEAQRLLDEEREKVASYFRELKDEQTRRVTEKAALMAVIKQIVGR